MHLLDLPQSRLALAFFLQLCLMDDNGVFGFGKYLQAHIQRKEGVQALLVKARSNSTRESRPRLSDGGDLYREIMSGSPSARQGGAIIHQPSTRDGDGIEIEIAAAILIASIFAVFIFIYTVLLQCWWKCRDRKPWGRVVKTKTRKAKKRGKHGKCACFAQLAFEPVEDLEKHLIEECSMSSSRASTSSSSSTISTSADLDTGMDNQVITVAR